MIMSFSHTPFLQSQSLIVNKWFPKNEMSLATSLINISIPIGSAIGFATTAVWFNGDDTDYKESLLGMIYVQNVALTCIFVVFMLFLREKPEQPPSAVALEPVPKMDMLDVIN
jgi:sugar phosphate permease